MTAACSQSCVETQRAHVEHADALSGLKFGSYMQRGARSKVEVLSPQDMRERWLDVRMEEWRSWNRGAPPEVEAAARADRARYLKEDVRAFAYKDTVYISPTLPPQAISHEVMHAKAAPEVVPYLLEHTDVETVNVLNESLTEHFNTQLNGGVRTLTFAEPLWPEYTAGPRALEQARNESLGGAAVGEEALRRFYFGGDTRALERAAASSGGVKAFIADFQYRYQRLLSAPAGGKP